MGRKFAAVVFSLGCLQASSALALGLGELKLESYLNEPLDASVDLLNTGTLHEDEIKIRLGTREDFQRLGLDRTFFLTRIQFDVEVDDSGNARIVMTTDDPVLEPYLDFIVEARWPTGRLLREYTVLIDPPAFSEGNVVVSASERVEEVEGIPAPGKKKAAETDTGTRVDIKKSELGPGEMPERNFNASTAGEPQPGSRYMVRRDQTLWDVASRARPEGVSVHQMMLDIQRLNPDAFINDNINRIKAGYIIYLPSAEDISSGDLDAALAEVRAQNAALREGRDAELATASRPTLRIAAEPDESTDTVGRPIPGENEDGSQAVAEDASGSAAISSDAAAQLSDMEQQLATLQRIVSIKDDQIAALQAALQNAGSADDGAMDGEAMDGEPGTTGDGGFDLLEDTAPMAEDDTGVRGLESDTTGQGDAADDLASASDDVTASPGALIDTESGRDDTAPAVASAQPEPASKAASTPPDAEGGLLRYWPYALGVALLALVGALLARRRRQDDDEDEVYAGQREAAEPDDVFADVKLRDDDLAVEEQPAPAPVSAAGVSEPREQPAPVDAGNRGYGKSKHDAYASDVEAADALAEADIYIAYGRHPQAIALLNNALANEPDNPVYRLKLLEIHTELNNRGSAMEQLEHIRRIGDRQSIERGEELVAGLDTVQNDPLPEVAEAPVRAKDQGPGLPPNPLDLMDDSGEELEDDFSGLSIETGDPAENEDELDLSSDFERGTDDNDDEELVVAADSNGLSTKLDLARAYLDMGDDDGARQILDEIIVEGSEELQAEARALLDRIG